jgi:hypothetical protein
MKKIVFLFIPLFFISCTKYHIKDNYKGIYGKAVIVDIKDSQYNPDGKNNYSDIYFDFIPYDKNAPLKYRFKDWKDTYKQLSYNSRMNLYKPWIVKMDIKKGNIYRAIRFEKKKVWGSSAPVVFRVLLKKKIK